MKKVTSYLFLISFMLSSCSLCLTSPSKDPNIRQGQACRDRGDYKVAIEHYLRALNDHLVRSGPSSIMVAAIHNCLGITYRLNGDYDKAIEHSTYATELGPKAYGLNHSQTANPYHNLGLAYECRGSYGDYSKAAEYYEKSSNVYAVNYGQNHKYSKREEQDRMRVLGMAKTQEGTQVLRIGGTNDYVQQGNIYKAKGDYGQAIQYYKEALKVYLDRLGAKHPDVTTCYNYLSDCYEEQYKEEDKEIINKYYKKALKVKLAKLDSSHVEMISSYDDLGWVYYFRGDHDRAIELFERILEIRSAKFGSNSVYVAFSCNDLGYVYRERGNYDKAIEYYERSTKIKAANFGGSDCPRMAAAYRNLGYTYEFKGDYAGAIKYYKKSLKIHLSKPEVNDQILQEIRQDTMRVLCAQKLESPGKPVTKSQRYLVSPVKYILSLLLCAICSLLIGWGVHSYSLPSVPPPNPGIDIDPNIEGRIYPTN